MIIQTRRRLVQAALELRDHGTVPPGVHDPEAYLAARGGDFLLDRSADWLQAYWAELRKCANPTGRLRVTPMEEAPAVK